MTSVALGLLRLFPGHSFPSGATACSTGRLSTVIEDYRREPARVQFLIVPTTKAWPTSRRQTSTTGVGSRSSSAGRRSRSEAWHSGEYSIGPSGNPAQRPAVPHSPHRGSAQEGCSLSPSRRPAGWRAANPGGPERRPPYRARYASAMPGRRTVAVADVGLACVTQVVHNEAGRPNAGQTCGSAWQVHRYHHGGRDDGSADCSWFHLRLPPARNRRIDCGGWFTTADIMNGGRNSSGLRTRLRRGVRLLFPVGTVGSVACLIETAADGSSQ